MPFFFYSRNCSTGVLGFVRFRCKEDFVEIFYLLQPNRTEFRGGDVRGGGEGGGRGGTGAMRRTVHINKVRFADVKPILFKKFVYVKRNPLGRKGLCRSNSPPGG